jgi:hypothetical protein
MQNFYLAVRLWIAVDNLTFDWRVGFGMKSPWEGDYGGGFISQFACVGDLSMLLKRHNKLKLLQIYSVYLILYPTGSSC